MRRKINHSKRYKDYPKNVPRKLLHLFFALDCKITWLANDRRVNTGVISALLNDGKEPKDNLIRQRLFLSPNPICKSCGRKVIHRISNPKPDYIIQWDHLPTEERHKVIKQYLKWRDDNETDNR